MHIYYIFIIAFLVVGSSPTLLIVAAFPSLQVIWFAMDSAAWSLTQQQRDETVDRIAKNISSIAFFKGLDISDADARASAVAAEKKAYTAAQVAARTTTGNRPHAETTSGYAR